MNAAPALVVAIAVALDGLFGDPRDRLHPVAWLGGAIDRVMRLAPKHAPRRELAFGALVALGFTLFVIGIGVALERGLAHAPTWVAIAIGAVVLDLVIALRGLVGAARTLVDTLAREDLDGARDRLAALCSRDARALDERALLTGAVASVAENANDAVVAPLFYYALFGLPGALAFRAINTLDAMLGYRDHREHVGKAAARLDDVAAFVPARLTACALLVGGALLGEDVRRGVATWARDARNTPSPNGGRPMATLAGLLGVVIDKPGVYVLGAEGRPIVRGDVHRANRVVIAGALAFACLAAALAVVCRG